MWFLFLAKEREGTLNNWYVSVFTRRNDLQRNAQALFCFQGTTSLFLHRRAKTEMVSLVAKSSAFIPFPEGLTCTHILQTEVKSKMNALNKGLQGEPALPQGFPARRAIRLAGLVATHACHLRPEALTAQGLGRLASACSDDRQRFGFNHLCCWVIWGLTRQIAQLGACALPPETTVPTGGSDDQHSAAVALGSGSRF